MSEDVRRRWEDIQHEIAIQVTQAMTSFRLTLDRLDRHTEELRATVYGRPELRQAGIIDRLEQFEGKITAIESKLDTLIDESRDRTNQIIGVRKAAYVLAALIAVIGGPPALAGLLRIFGITI